MIASAIFRRLNVRLDVASIVDVVAIFGVLLGMLLANVEWAFTREDWVDTWMYFGFFRHYDVSSFLAGNKKIARLPWILIGFAVNRLFNPNAAALVLHVGCFVVGAYFLYRLADEMFGRGAAVLTTLTYLTWVPNHGSGGWDYHNTLLPVFYYTAYRALVWAASAQTARRTRFGFFGLLFALAVHTNIFVVLLVPVFVLRALFQRSRLGDAPGWLRDAFIGTVAGGVCVTVLLGILNALAGRGFFFWDLLVSRSAFLVQHPVLEKGWWFPWSDPWWTSNINTPLLNAVLLLTFSYLGVALWRRSLQPLTSSATCAMLEFLAGLAVFSIGQTLGHPLLEPFYMAMPLTLPMFLALAALIAKTINTGDVPSPFVILAGLAFGIQFIGRLSVNPDFLFHWQPGTWTSDVPVLVIVAGGFGFAALAARAAFIPRNLQPFAFSFASLAIVLGQANTLWPIAADDRSPYDYRTRACKTHEALLSAVAQSDDILFRLLRNGRQIVLWYPGHELHGTPSCTLATYQLGRPLFAMGYGAGNNVHYWDPESDKQIPNRILTSLRKHDTLVLITDSHRYVDAVVRRLRHYERPWAEVASYRVGNYGISFDLHIIASTAIPAGRAL